MTLFEVNLWRQSLSWKVHTQLVKEFPAVTNKNVPYRAHKSPASGPILIHLYFV